ncbi:MULTISPECIES: LysR family transcriptional regulator [Tatumella]|uniref:LysR substrate-binding domain-containing protein n=1 Tax=Tatumella punctata TaxID=399969 RepID=A0ABW1VNP0_9GAMM|nr:MULTISPECIES: LysR family transcriptional regulator [unclassified Tatumella]MBS0856326.1 LysR family transcriptional regulator [Tatumella sp. JGM16]MBS0876325.1 LysR family transcriptional regulator [Tatumella sp. JGM82]MBS0889498.1 LysR family transcriptional regulator [Tatumella sp. JGM94]MBS0894306.1 LysR family transcriptional regulator [Tatumella sp. JGM130]MBS0900620.1 LysR family transcriptional regulator [Tatumella sp. JGM100]
MNYTLRQLKVFATVASQGSFSLAGQIIGLSQSAVSHSIKQLESEIGVKLLDRTTREVLLTHAGQRLASRLTVQLEELNSTLLELRRYGGQRSGTVRLAASQTISARLMPLCLAEARECYPEIRLLLQDSVQQSVLQSVRNATVDFGIVIDPRGEEFDSQPVLSDPFLLLCRDDDPLNQIPVVGWHHLQGRRMVLQDYASGSRILVDRIFQQQQISPEIVQQVGHPVTLYPMVEAGIGISILPGLALPLPAGSRLRVRRIMPEVCRTLMLIRRKNRSLSPAAEAIWALVCEQAEKLNGERPLLPDS